MSKPTVKCPTCQTEVEWSKDSTWRPFCSERCKLIDLGEWAEEGYRIPEKGPRPWSDDNGSDE